MGMSLFSSNQIENRLLDMINNTNNKNQIIISSFNPFILKRVKKLNSHLSIALIWSRRSYRWFTVATIPNYKVSSSYCNPDVFHVNISDVNQKMVNWFQARNIPLYAYTVNTQSDLDKAKKYNLNGIFTDNPKMKNV